QQEVVILARQETRTEVALLAALQQMPQIATGLSAQTIQRTPDRSAAAVLSRVTGVSLQDGRFLVVRGMSERYNPVLLNRLPAPATEPDSRGFDLEILPAGLIDQVRVYKTPAAYQSADFGGGIVEILTRRSTEKPTFHFQLRSAYLQGTTFRPGLANVHFPSDWWGGGVAERALPAGFPQDLSVLSVAQARQWAEALPNTFRVQRIPTVMPAVQMALTYGTPLGKKLWLLTGGSYSRSFQTLTVERNRYEVRVLAPGANPKLFAYQDYQTTHYTRAFGFTNLIWVPSRAHQLELNAFLARLVEDETIVREGFSLYQRGADVPFRNYSLQYLARTLASIQVGGVHQISEKNTLRWDVGGSATLRDEPDFRRVRTVKEPGDSVYRIITPPGPTTFDAARFYSALRQYGVTGQVSWLTEWKGIKLVAGFHGHALTRSFWARWFSYTIPATASPAFVLEWTALPIEKAFSHEYLSVLRLREGTNPTDRYEAQQYEAAAFLSGERQWNRLSLALGLRYEYTQQVLTSATAVGPLSVRTPFPLFMPFLQAGYTLSARERLRLAYSRSLNRPALREIAPFLYYNFALEIQQAGNPTLRPASLHHLDLRYELSPSLDQLVAVGAFYKHIENPIETYILRGADQPTVRFGNAPQADLLGFEVEARLRLARRLSGIFNAAYIWSQVDMGLAVYGTSGATAASQNRFRPLQGQAPYLVNVLLLYTSLDNRWEVAMAGQLNGPRLWWVGDNFNPSVFE
ncbi:MAG: TonB-dependent receptor, partial [Bacteroidetes bacterium]